MDNQQPGRGQQKIVINHPPRSSSPADAAAGCGCLVLILLVAFFHGIFSGSSTSDSIDDTSTASDNSNTPISSPYNSDQPLLTSNLTSVTRPGGSYAAFVPASETVSEAFLFKEDFLEIHVVQNENEIPSNDRVAAMRPQRNGQDTSYVPKFDPTFKGIQFPSGPYHAIDNSRPVVFYGGVDIIAGPIAEHDQWTAEYQAVNGNVVNIRTLY